jgi:hypothetical protein
MNNYRKQERHIIYGAGNPSSRTGVNSPSMTGVSLVHTNNPIGKGSIDRKERCEDYTAWSNENLSPTGEMPVLPVVFLGDR